MIFSAALFIKITAVAVAYGAWHWTQKKLGQRQQQDSNQVVDLVHVWTAQLNEKINQTPRLSQALIFSSSLIVDILGVYLIFSAVFGNQIRPLIGLIILFSLRQINQAITLLPTPKGMIWKNPGFPSLFVTYKVSNDLFFSGHTALATYGLIEIAASANGLFWSLLAVIIAIYEIIVVLLLRAHWTMDVFTGAVTALWVFQIASYVSPSLDAWLSTL